MGKEKIKAIVLRQTKYSDNDKIITVFSFEKGKMSLIAKGATGTKSKTSASCEIFSCSEFTLNSKDDKISYIESADVISSFKDISKDMYKMCCASFICDLVNQTFEEGVEDQRIFKLLYVILKYLSEGDLDNSFYYTLVFILKFTGLIGIGLKLDSCISCHNESDRYFIDFDKGGIICLSCNDSYNKEYPLIDYSDAKYMFLLSHIDISKLDEVTKIDLEFTKKMIGHIYDYYAFSFSKRLKSYEIMISI